MRCFHCGKDLSCFGDLVRSMSKCPECGEVLIKKPQYVKQVSIEKFLKELQEKFGSDIFRSEEKLINTLISIKEPNYANAKDDIAAFCIKRIFSKMGNIAESENWKRPSILEDCQSAMCEDLGLSYEKFKTVMQPLQEIMWGVSYTVNPITMKENEFTDLRDGHRYKTVKIGKLIWMTEPLKYKCEGYHYDGFYNVDALEYCAPKGWRVPTKQDFHDLVNCANEAGNGPIFATLMKKGAWDKFSVTPTDDIGFSLTPDRISEGIAEIWTSEKIIFSVETDSYEFRQPAAWDVDHYARVRLVKDVIE